MKCESRTAVRNRIFIVNSRFLQLLQKLSSGNQLTHRRLSKSKSIGRGQNKRPKQAGSQMLMVNGVGRGDGEGGREKRMNQVRIC